MTRRPDTAPVAAPATAPATAADPAARPGVVVDLRDRPLPAAPADGRRARLVRLQVLDVQRAALLHARVSGRRRTPALPV